MCGSLVAGSSHAQYYTAVITRDVTLKVTQHELIVLYTGVHICNITPRGNKQY